MKELSPIHLIVASLVTLALGIAMGYFVGLDVGYDRGVIATMPARINSFDDCAAAGYPVMESYPRQCRAYGRLFVEAIDEPIIPPDDRPMPVEPDGGIGDGAGGCVPAGCSQTICAELSEVANIVTTCEYRAEYACYELTKCERQADGKCGWTQTADFRACLASPPPLR